MVSTGDAALVLGVSRRTVQRWVREGRLRVTRSGARVGIRVSVLESPARPARGRPPSWIRDTPRRDPGA
ncbi:MAG: helix-turn-helix domain-containing protein [Bifidobacteriaceae bacterium]|nr:helix-turn-helix domain-containing protein [Bifidobacteriaceae bacterium]